MTLTRLALSNPAAAVVARIFIANFGALSLARLPIQMTPEISRPEISIMTSWRAVDIMDS
jgi:multidrug efflux pump subunit AcrB